MPSRPPDLLAASLTCAPATRPPTCRPCSRRCWPMARTSACRVWPTRPAARAAIVDAHHRHPLAAIWSDGSDSSSDGQYFRAGGRAGPGGAVNAKYGIDPGVVLYTTHSGQYGPMHTRVISATASEAPYVLDGLHPHAHRTSLRIVEHYTDTAGATVMWTGCVPAATAVVAWERSAVRAEVRHGWGEAIRGCRQQAYDRGRGRLWYTRAGRGSVPCPPRCPRLLAQHRSRLRLRPRPPLALPRRRATGLGPADSGVRR